MEGAFENLVRVNNNITTLQTHCDIVETHYDYRHMYFYAPLQIGITISKISMYFDLQNCVFYSRNGMPKM